MPQLFHLVRRNPRFFVLFTLAAVALRLFFVFHLRVIDGDTFVYGDIAKNWLNHGIFGLTHGAQIGPTLIRLPGYPAFLAVIFSLAGQEHYGAVLIAQALIDLVCCLVIAALAVELIDQRAAKPAFALAALCPFTANYAAAALTETLAIFTTACSLYYGIRALKSLDSGGPHLRLWLACGLWASASIYLRPDDLLVVVPFGIALLIRAIRGKDSFRKGIASAVPHQAQTAALAAEGTVGSSKNSLQINLRRASLIAALVLACAVIIPLVPWAARNWMVFHQFQPLASRYANDPDEYVPTGFNRWVRTWSADFVSVDDIYWKVPGERLDVDNLPERAFDSRQQYDQTDELISDYNLELYIDEDMNARFEQVAQQRIAHSRFRYYVWLPLLRTADMWLRPRTELLPFSIRWWEYSEHPGETRWAVFLGLVNLCLLIAAAWGWLRWRRSPPFATYSLVLIAFVLLRSIMLSSLENPEPRYTLECFPVVLVFAAAAFIKRD